MLIDAKLLFCQDFDLDTISASSNSEMTNVLDMGAGKDEWQAALAVPNVGRKGKMEWVVMCESEDFASAGSPVITIKLRASAAAVMSSPVTLLSFTTDKTPNAGDLLFAGKVPSFPEDLRYFSVNVATTAALTAGQITSFLDLGGVI